MSKGFYVGLNEIIDTRAGAIKCLRPDLYADIVREGNGYHQRKGDFFPGITKEEYQAKYHAQEFELLEEGTVSNVFQFLYPQIADLMTEAIAAEADLKDRPMLDVNIWPYELNDQEISAIRTMVYLRTGGIIGIRMINTPISEMLPTICSDKYLMMIMYDYHNYINAHSHALIKNPVPTLLLVGPMVYFNTNPDENEETIDQLNHGINSLSILEASLAPRIGLKFINVDVFSILYPDDRVHQMDAASDEVHHTLDDLEAELRRREKATETGASAQSGL